VTLLDEAHRIAADVLFPAAMEVDTADRVPAGHLDLLASAGLYGAGAPDSDLPAGLIAEALAGGCLATAFVWLQHQGVLRSVAGTDRDGVRRAWLEPLRRGERRAGIALGALRPGPPLLRARQVDGGYLLDGESPWVTGWGMIDTLHVAARTDTAAVWTLVDAVESATLSVTPLRLLAVNASGTVTLRLHDHFVPEERVTGTLPYAAWAARDAVKLGFNGRLALGVAQRCLQLAEAAGCPAPDLAATVTSVRAALESELPHALPVARADASALAMRAASLLVVAAGAGSVLADPPGSERGAGRAEPDWSPDWSGSERGAGRAEPDWSPRRHAQRLLREAGFLLVFGSRPAIRDALVARLRAAPPEPPPARSAGGALDHG
jgi:hypothetical protein